MGRAHAVPPGIVGPFSNNPYIWFWQTPGPQPSLARLLVNRWVSPRQVRPSKKWGHTVKKLVVLALIALGGLLVWRKVQADRAELDLWTEATGSEN